MVMGAESAVSVVYQKQLSALPPEQQAAVRQKYIDEYRNNYENPYLSVGMMENDAIIRPRMTRQVLIQALEALEGKTVQPLVKKKHGNIPL